MGVAIPEPQRADLAEYVAACQLLAPDYSWVPATNLHLTLRFLGNVAPATLEAVRQSLTGVRRPSFRICIGTLGMFGPRRSPRVVWLGLGEGEQEMAALAGAVEKACQDAGLPPADYPFRPHLTLARARRAGRGLPPLPEPPAPVSWQAAEFLLFESRQTRPHPTYIPMERVPLG